MPGVVRNPDICSGHQCWPPRANIEWSPDVYTNSLFTERFSDKRMVHCCGSSCHVGANIGVHNVYVNSKYIQTCGDGVDCGSTQIQCSMDVFVN